MSQSTPVELEITPALLSLVQHRRKLLDPADKSRLLEKRDWLNQLDRTNYQIATHFDAALTAAFEKKGLTL